jgi:hypothetical protein
VRHFAATEADSELDLVTLFEKARNATHFRIVVVIIDHWPHFDLFGLNDFLIFARLSGFLLLLELKPTIVKDFAHWRICLGRDLNQIEAGTLC